MADSNNALAGKISPTPDPSLRSLDRFVGTWAVSGPTISGTASFEWMEGGFFFIQRVDLRHGERPIRGVEYIGFDEDTRTLRSHYMDSNGSNFTYTWLVDGDSITTWFGDEGSDNVFHGAFAEDGLSYAGAWTWPGGGYEATMTRVPDDLGAGVEVLEEPVTRPWGVRDCAVRDPSGNLVRIQERR